MRFVDDFPFLYRKIMRIHGSGKALSSQPLETSTGSIYAWISCLGHRSSNPFCLKFSCVITQSYLQKNIHDSQLHKNAWEPGYVQLLRYSGRISSLFPEALKPRVGEHGQAELILQAKTCCTLHICQKRDFCDEFVEALFWGNSHKMGPVTGYK